MQLQEQAIASAAANGLDTSKARGFAASTIRKGVWHGARGREAVDCRAKAHALSEQSAALDA
jgi:hypothetical protein